MPEKKRKANSILQFCRTLHVHVSDLLMPYIKNLSFATLAKSVIVVMMMIIRLVFELMFTHPGNKEHAFLQLYVQPRASQTHDSRNRSNIIINDLLCTRIE